MKNFILLLFIALCSVTVFGQGKQSPPQSEFDLFSKSTVEAAEKEYKEVTDGDLINIDLTELKALRNSAPAQFNLNIPLGEGKSMELNLEKIQIFTESFKVETSGRSSVQDIDLGAHYKGTIAGNTTSLVSLSVYKDQLVGLISNGKHDYELVKLKDNASRYILYKIVDLEQRIKDKLFNFKCYTEGSGKDSPKYTEDQVFNTNRSSQDCKFVEIYLVADNSYYLVNGSNVGVTVNKLTSVFAQTKIIYDAESINILLSGTFVWETQDTFLEGDGARNQRDDFRDYYNGDGAGWPGDLAQLISGFEGNGAGGIAYFDGLCTSDSYALTQAGDEAPIEPWTSYSRFVKVLTHEMGHNFNSRHTHACVWNGNSTQIDDYGNVSPSGSPYFNAEGGACLNEPYLIDVFPTIMSYFDSRSHGTFPMSNGMGTQPGNVMRNYIANASCLTNGSELPPIAVCQDITIQLDNSGKAFATAAAVDNGSYDACGGVPTSLSLSQTSFDCSDIGDNSVTLNVTDSHGNVSSCQATVIVEDKVLPSIICPPNVIIECDADSTPLNTGSPTATDNCDSNPSLTFSDVTNLNGCGSTGTITRTWTATDASGNFSNCVQTITVEDSKEPSITCPNNVTVECSSDTSPAATGTATATDNCDPNPSFTFSDVTNLNGCGSTGTITRTWTATDECGNFSTCDQIITVVDTTPPNAICQDITVQLGMNEEVTITAAQIDNGSNDACGNVSLAIDVSSFSCYVLGDHTVTLTVTDECGNENSCTATVTLEGPDEDCDTVADICDECPGGDDTIDNNGDGLPDCAYYPGFDNLIEAWKCGKLNNKVLVCHRPQGNTGSAQTICIGQGAVAAHLAHGDYLGPCNDANCVSKQAIPSKPLTDKGSNMQMEVAPNPVNDETTISISLPKGSYAEIEIYNFIGQRVYQIHSGIIDSPMRQFKWNGASEDGSLLPSGVYFIVLKSNSQWITKKLILK